MQRERTRGCRRPRDVARPVLGVLALGLVVAAPARATVSTFDSDTEGWVTRTLSFPAAVTTPGSSPPVVGTHTPAHNASGGNPGGFLSLADPDTNASYWYAPSQYLGDQSAAYGGTLSFDLRQDTASLQFSQEDVILVGGGLVLALDTPLNPGTTFTPYVLSLTEVGGWRRDSLNGPVPTQAEMQTVLGNLTDLYIRGEYSTSLDTFAIDNVAIVPEPATSALLAVVGVALATRRRRHR